MPRLVSPVLILSLAALAACDLFAPRTPEPPGSEGGTFAQPDTPDLVVQNITFALAEMNTGNYLRSLAEDLTFEPAAPAEARNPSLWPGWGPNQERSYFSTMAAAAQPEGHELRLIDPTSDAGETRYVLDATYFLVVNHLRPGVPDTLQGRLIWEIVQGNNGLWQLQQWTDQAFGSTPSWSDLKAEFMK